MRNVVVLALVLGLAGFGASGLVVPGQELADSKPASLDSVIDMNLTDGTLLLALGTLAVDYRVPIGFEHVQDSRNSPNRQIHVEKGTLKEILDSLMAQEPRYTWVLRDGVINVTPVVDRDEFLAQFLDTRVAQFSPSPRMTDKFKLRDAILELPEVKQLLKSRQVTVRPYTYQSARSIYYDEHVDLRISNTDVRGVLNHIARESEHKMWDAERVGDKKELLVTY